MRFYFNSLSVFMRSNYKFIQLIYSTHEFVAKLLKKAAN